MGDHKAMPKMENIMLKPQSHNTPTLPSMKTNQIKYQDRKNPNSQSTKITNQILKRTSNLHWRSPSLTFNTDHLRLKHDCKSQFELSSSALRSTHSQSMFLEILIFAIPNFKIKMQF